MTRTLSDLMSRKDSLLTAQQWKTIDAEVVTAARAAVQGRRVFAGATKTLNDPGVITLEYNEQTGMSAATISLLGEDGGAQADRTDKMPKTLQIPVLEKDWELPWRIKLAGDRNPTALGPLDVEQATEAAVKVVELEEELLSTGKGPWKGLLNATGIQTYAGGAWSAATDAGWEARANDLAEAIFKLQDKNMYGVNGRYQVLVNPKQWAQMHKVKATAGGRAAASSLNELQAQFDFIPWAKVTADKVYVRDPSPLNADLIIGFDLQNVELPKTGLNFRGRTHEGLITRVKRPTSIVEVTVT